ncbi:hypothetical protein F2981_14140 [Sinorhizobium meliloti]|nr:hypothetical protein [Sinorhizobium meliloti]
MCGSYIEATRDAVYGRELPRRLTIFTVPGNARGTGTLSTLISVPVTEIQQRRVCGAGNVLSGLGLAGFL